jgi:hypothetical protein
MPAAEALLDSNVLVYALLGWMSTIITALAGTLPNHSSFWAGLGLEAGEGAGALVAEAVGTVSFRK